MDNYYELPELSGLLNSELVVSHLSMDKVRHLMKQAKQEGMDEKEHEMQDLAVDVICSDLDPAQENSKLLDVLNVNENEHFAFCEYCEQPYRLTDKKDPEIEYDSDYSYWVCENCQQEHELQKIRDREQRKADLSGQNSDYINQQGGK